MENRKKLIIIIGGTLIVAIIATIIVLATKNHNALGNNEVPEVELNTEMSNSLYSLVTNVNCDNTLIFDFKDKQEILVKDFTQEQRLNLIFRYLEINNKLKESVAKEDFEDAVKKVFGPNFTESFNIVSFKYKDNTWNATKNVIKSEKSENCKESNIVTKNFSYIPSEIGIEIGLKDGNKLYNMNHELVGKFNNDEELNLLLDESTAYYYNYDFYKEEAYLVKITPLVKVKGIK